MQALLQRRDGRVYGWFGAFRGLKFVRHILDLPNGPTIGYAVIRGRSIDRSSGK